MTKKEENKKTEKKIKKISQKSSNKKSEFWVALQSQLLDFGTLALKKGIANMAIAKIDDTEEKITKVIEEKIQKHSAKIIKTLIKTIAIIFAASFISYGLLEIILKSNNLSDYTNLIFGLIFGLVAFIVNTKK